MDKYVKEYFSDSLDKDNIKFLKERAQERLDNETMRNKIQNSNLQNPYMYATLVDEDKGFSYEYPCN